MRLPAIGFTLPWQLVAAQEPGPMYFVGSADEFFVSARNNPQNSAKKAQLAAVAMGRL